MANTFAELKNKNNRSVYLKEMLIQHMPERKRKVVVGSKVHFVDETNEQRNQRLSIIFDAVGDLSSMPTHFLTMHFNKNEKHTDVDFNSTYQSFTRSLSKAVYGKANWKKYKKEIRSVGAIEGKHFHSMIWAPSFISNNDFGEKVKELVLGNPGWEIREQDFEFRKFDYNIEKYTMRLLPIRFAPLKEKLVILDYCLKGVPDNPQNFICSGR